MDNLYFQRNLLKVKVRTSTNKDSLSYSDYLLNDYNEGKLKTIEENTIGLPGKIINYFRSKPVLPTFVVDDEINKVSNEETMQILIAKKQLNLSFDDLAGLVKIKATTHDPILSEQLVKRCEELLQQTIIDLSIEKSTIELDFLEKRFEIALKDYNAKRAALGNFRDRNKYALTSYTKNIEEQLEGEYRLSNDIYSQIASQIESTKLQIARDTPIFTTIKPPVVPSRSSSVSSSIIVLASALIGLVLGLLIISLSAVKPIISNYIKSEFK